MLTAPDTPGRRAGVVGSPIGHSLSPVLHRTAYSVLGLRDWQYTAADVPAGALAEHLAGLGPAWAALSVTMPLKQEALDAASTATALARQTGGANTLLRGPDGGWTADNTDVHGIRAALAGAGVTECGEATLIGSGATAGSAVAALAGMGLTRLTVLVRDRVRPQLVQQAAGHHLTLDQHRYPDAPAVLSRAPLVLSTVPAGATPAVDRVVPAVGAVLLDVGYADWPTPLARHFLDGGATVVDGLDVLVHQAAEQVRLMTGAQPPGETMLDAMLEAMLEAGRREAGR